MENNVADNKPQEIEVPLEEQKGESTQSQRPLTPRGTQKKLTIKESDLYFANRADRLSRAEELLRKECIIADIDGSYLKLYVLTEVDHWNHDHERVVLLCEQSVLSVNYNFITEKWTELTRINIKCISKVQFGNLSFPKRTLQWPRPYKCLKVTYERLTGPATTAENWNPFAKHLPFCTLSSHPLMRRAEGPTEKYDIEPFKDELLDAISKYTANHPEAPHSPEIQPDGDIEFNVRLGLTSFVFNQSHLAYAKDRGGIHF